MAEGLSLRAVVLCQLRHQLRLDSERIDHAVYTKRSSTYDTYGVWYWRLLMSDLPSIWDKSVELPNLACTCTWPLCQLCILKPPVFSDSSQLVSHLSINFLYHQVSPDQTLHLSRWHDLRSLRKVILSEISSAMIEYCWTNDITLLERTIDLGLPAITSLAPAISIS